MKIDKEEFLKSLFFLTSGTSDKNIISESDHFLFTGKYLVSYNDFICVFCPFKSDTSFAIPANEFISLISNLKDDQFEFKIKDNHVKITGKRIKAEITTKVEFDEIKDFVNKTVKGSKKGEWKPLPDDFIEALVFCSFSAARDLSKPELCSVYIDGNKAFSSDRIRISEYKMSDEVEDKIMLPLNSVKELMRFKDEEVREYKISGPWVYIKFESKHIFSTRIIDSEFPDILDFFKFKGSQIGKLPKGLNDAIGISSIFAEGDFDIDKLVNVKIDGAEKKMYIESRNDIGSVEQELKFRTVKFKKKISFKINPIFLGQILVRSPKVILGEDRIQFSSNKFRHLVSLPVD